MTTLIPRRFYSQEELDKLYPKELELQLVQIVRPIPPLLLVLPLIATTATPPRLGFSTSTYLMCILLTGGYRRKKSSLSSLPERVFTL
jgi:hypothetical protein